MSDMEIYRPIVGMALQKRIAKSRSNRRKRSMFREVPEYDVPNTLAGIFA